MTSTATPTTGSTAAVLDGLRAKKAEIARGEVEKAELTIEWALLNEADPAACVGFFADKSLPVAGPGAPLVSEFALMEYAAALGVTTESGFAQVGGSSSCATGSPSSGDGWWRGGCRCGGPAGSPTRPPASQQPVRRRWTGTSRRSRTRARGRSWTAPWKKQWSGSTPQPPKPSGVRQRRSGMSTSTLDDVSFDGTIRIDAEVDLADALDLEDALRAGAKQQADLGSTESLDVRRAKALGDLARRQLAFGFEDAEPGRAVDLVVHISEDARPAPRPSAGAATPGPRSAWSRSASGAATANPGHREAGGRPGRPHPRRGLRSPRPTQGPERPGRRALRVPALHQTSADATPTTSFPTPRRPTSSTNTAPLCRRHHRAKTHSAWDYSVPGPRHLPLDVPNGLRLIRDHRGTSSLPGEP